MRKGGTRYAQGQLVTLVEGPATASAVSIGNGVSGGGYRLDLCGICTQAAGGLGQRTATGKLKMNILLICGTALGVVSLIILIRTSAQGKELLRTYAALGVMIGTLAAGALFGPTIANWIR